MKPFYVVLPMFLIFFIFLLSINQYSALELILLVFFVGVISLIGINYFFGVEITSTLSSLFSKPKVDIDILNSTKSSPFDFSSLFKSDANKTNQPNQPNQTNQTNQTNQPTKFLSKPETYHISGNFDYSMAKSVCKAYDATLATLDQIKESYKKGGEWCDYGWSEDEMVLYPTQESSWKLYQEGDDKHQCGIPGINGGYNSQLNQQLGVNCYGVKPSGKMPIQMTPVEKKMLPKQGTLSPFNYTKWNA